MQPSTLSTSPRVPTLAHALARHAERQPDLTAVSYRRTGGSVASYTYAQLHQKAAALGGLLAPLKKNPGDTPFVLIALSNGLDYVASFFGCLMADAAAVTFHPPALSTARAGRNYDLRAQRIIEDCRPAAVIAEPALHTRLRGLAREVGLEPLLIDPQMPSPTGAGPLGGPLASPEHLALLQYTSGSTSEPKGVMVSHSNLVHNSAGLARNLGSGPGQTAVGWLPLFHDMGLIGMICHPLWAGMSVRMNTPAGFLRDPASWLQDISSTGATVTIAPDFGYATAVRKVSEDKRSGLDLSSLRHALSGAEPVRARTIEGFTKAYAPYGFNRSALMPVYGLAEATLCVSCLDHQAEPSITEASAQGLREGHVKPSDGLQRITVVGCGRSFTDDTDVCVIDPERHTRMPDGVVGEVWISGPSVAGGYWKRADATAETFGARVVGERDRTYLRTGDLGVWHGGQLHIVGRRKDVIVHHGVNHHPQDLEATAESAHSAIGRAAALGITDSADPGVDRLVLLLETSDYHASGVDHDAVGSAVRGAITEAHGVPVSAVALLRPGAVPRTTSGKVRRRESARRWSAGEFTPLAVWHKNKGLKGE